MQVSGSFGRVSNLNRRHPVVCSQRPQDSTVDGESLHIFHRPADVSGPRTRMVQAPNRGLGTANISCAIEGSSLVGFLVSELEAFFMSLMSDWLLKNNGAHVANT